MKEKTKAIIQFFLLFFIIVALSVLLWKPFAEVISNPQEVRDFISEFGILAPLAFIVLTILQVLLAPIPGNFVAVGGGFLFGGVFGTIYGMFGLVIGSYIAFALARTFGRPFVEKVIDKKTLNKWDKRVSNKGVNFFFWLFLIPGLPDDSICYLAGLTNIKIRTLVVIAAIGRLPGYIVSAFMGAGLASQDYILVITLFIALMIAALFAYLYKERLERFAMKILKRKK